MEGFEFLASVPRLSLIASMLEKTDVQGMLEYMNVADTVAPLFGGRTERLSSLRGFISKALEFQRECARYRDQLAQADQVASHTRLEAVNPLHPDQPPTLPVPGA